MQKKRNFFTENQDLMAQWQKIAMDKIYDWASEEDKAATGTEDAEGYRATWQEILTTIGEVCGTEIAANAEQVEKEDLTLKDGEVTLPPTLTQNIDQLLQLGTAALGVNPKYGGLGAPFIVELIANELLFRACPSTALNMVWFGSIAQIVDKFGSDHERDMVIAKICEGTWSGNMALTEPDAGSDLANLTTYGEEQGDGTYKLYGTKRFISNGNGQVSLVLAKNKKGAKGLKNLNLYMCLRNHDDGTANYKVEKVEEKVGLHGSATCELVYDGSKAWRLGKDGEGFKYMLYLMNDARIAVAFQGLGLMDEVYHLASTYASERTSWDKPIARHERVAEMLFDMETELKAVRSLSYRAGYTQSMVHYGEKLLKSGTLSEEKKLEVEKELSRFRRRIRRWTPLIKWYVGERSYEFARTGLQLHGGYGFTKEYRAEWLVRESLILSIYEGTSQIQGLMCAKDVLKEVIRKPRDFIEHALGYRVQALRESDSLRKKLNRARQLAHSAVVGVLFQLLKAHVRATLSEAKSTDLMRAIKILSSELVKFENLSPAFLHAERICEMKAIVAHAESLVWDAEEDSERRIWADRYLDTNIPRLQMLRSQIDLDATAVMNRVHGVASDAATEVDSAVAGK